MTVQSFYQFCKLRRIFFTVIFASHQTILKGKSAPCFFKIISTGRYYFWQWVFIGNGHQFPSLFIGGCMQWQCQSDRKTFLCQLPDSGNNSAGRYCQISLTDILTFSITENPDKPKKVIIVIHRFSCPHHHHIWYPFSRQFLNPIYLIQHLGWEQISGQSANSRSAKPAAHAAAHLWRDTHRIAMLIFHPDTFNHIAVTETEQIFLRPVNPGSLYIHRFQPGQRLFLL